MKPVRPVSALLLLTLTAPCCPADEAEDKAAAFLQKLGGSVIRDEKRAGQPVVEVQLFHRAVTDADLKELAKLKHLRVLYLSGNKVTDAGLAELANLEQLQVLSLSDNKVTDAGLKVLA